MDNLLNRLDIVYGIRPGDEKVNEIHITALKLFVMILDLLKPNIEAVLNEAWLTKYRNNELAIIYEFSNSLFRGPLALSIEEYFETKDVFTIIDLREGIYRTIFDYIFDDEADNFTPWDVLLACKDEDGESLFKTVTFPSETITVEVYVIDRWIIYDLDLNQFMGILFSERIMGLFRLKIMGILVSVDSFRNYLEEYLDILGATTFRLTYRNRIAQFDDIGFLSGFLTMLSHIYQNVIDMGVKLEYLDEDLTDYQEVAIKLG